MFYYFVWVRSNRYHGSEPLTYSSAEKLATGKIVEVELQKNLVLGFISGPADKPKFKTKEISKVLDLPALPNQTLKLAEWLRQFYPTPIGATTIQILPASISEKRLLEKTHHKLDDPDPRPLPKLTEEQLSAIDKMEFNNTYLLHGRTGSGKTRIYIEMALKSIANNKSCLVLTPEISLTSQLADSFRKIFKNRVIVLHSKQTPLQRQEAWLKCINSDESLVIIGPRSALFAPLKQVGLIVIDEAHETAYKQEQSPQYHTTRVASYLAGLTKSWLILGSATPLVTDYFLAEQKAKPIIELNQLARKNELLKPKITLVDRKKHELFNRSSLLSQPLIEQIEAALSRNEQSLLYLNRRGTARLVLCENCGWQALCPHCDVPLTYHGDKHQMRCHSCNYHSSVPVSCPSCDHVNVVFKTAGTKAIVDEVRKIFPQSTVARFDTDNLKSESFEQNYEAARDGKIDILIGTQMIAKGLDLPRLSTVGILLADTSLYIPDFSAQERTYELITQVLGRIGRGHIAGQAIIQTYDPDNEILNLAVKNDYSSFYKTELANRKQFLFPPYCYLLKLSLRRATLKGAESAALKLKNEIISGPYEVRVEGPAPAFQERFQGKYQWQLVVKSTKRSELIKIIKSLPVNWSYDLDPMDLL
jgi:primosomal protein N' (replication factor Y)